MATERRIPDSIASFTAMTADVGSGDPIVTEIDDDPDSGDAFWAKATGNNVDGDIRVTFPTPTGTLTVGAGLQEFRAQVRQFDTGQTGTPTARIELWQNGSLVRAGSNIDVTGSGQVIAFTWDADELTSDPTGIQVECKIVNVHAGGGPTVRNSVDIGAVEWNVDFFTTTLIGDNLDVRWNLLSLINDDLDIRWNMIGVIGDNLDIRWDMDGIIGDSLDIRWDITLEIGDSLDIRWNLLSLAPTHEEDAQSLTGDGYVDLFEITLTNNSKLFLKADNDVTWQGQDYEGTAIQITGVGHSSSEENKRPSLAMANPDGVFSAFIASGTIDNAVVKRIRVLREDLLVDSNVFRQQSWKIRRVVTLNKEQITVELRDQLDGQFFLVPGRMFLPPEFPQVSLS